MEAEEFLTPRALEHWEWAQKDRDHGRRDRGCVCPLCELVPTLPSKFSEVWEEGYSDGQYNYEAQHLIERGLKDAIKNPYGRN